MKVWELLDTSTKWTQDGYARQKGGERVEPNAKRAVCWCALGALRHCYQEQHSNLSWWEQPRLKAKITAIFDHLKISSVYEIVLWNDHDKRGFKEVYNLFKTLDI